MKLYSPAIISAKNRLVLGHGANIVWCDILGRRIKDKGGNVQYFFPSWNHHGSRFDGVDPDERLRLLDNLESSLTKSLDFFGISHYTPYRDSHDKSQHNARTCFLKLANKGFISKSGNRYFLDIGSVVRKTAFLRNLDHVTFLPDDQVRKRILDLAKNLNGLYPISKPIQFATEVPVDNHGQQKLNPIFDLAVSPLLFSEEPVDYAIDGSRTLLHGTFIPLVIWAGLLDMPFSRNICVHGYCKSSGELARLGIHNIANMIRHRLIVSDILRYCALLCTDSFEDTAVNADRVRKAEQVLLRSLNIAKHIARHRRLHAVIATDDPRASGMIDQKRPLKAAHWFFDAILEFSRKIRRDGPIDIDNAKRYLEMMNSVKSLFPVTCRRAGEIVYHGRE